jgi:hypothetical protein
VRADGDRDATERCLSGSLSADPETGRTKPIPRKLEQISPRMARNGMVARTFLP